MYQNEAQQLQGQVFEGTKVMFGIDVVLVAVQRAIAREMVVVKREVFVLVTPSKALDYGRVQGDKLHIRGACMARSQMACGPGNGWKTMLVRRLLIYVFRRCHRKRGC